MSEEFSAGVKILLQRMETNPDEFMEHGKFEMYVSDILRRKFDVEIHHNSHVRFFTDAEVDALFEGVSKLKRKHFDDHIMRKVLQTDEVDNGVELSSAIHPTPAAKNSTYGWSDPRVTQLQLEHLKLQQQYEQSRMIGLQNAAQNMAHQAIGASNYPYDTQLQQGSIIARVAKSLGVK